MQAEQKAQGMEAQVHALNAELDAARADLAKGLREADALRAEVAARAEAIAHLSQTKSQVRNVIMACAVLNTVCADG